MKLAVIFDFDLTLSPVLMLDPLLIHWGVQPKEFWDSCLALQGPGGYDMEHSYLKRLVEEGQRDPKRRLNREKLIQWGGSVPLYPGLVDTEQGPGLFKALKAAVPPGQLELFIISGGLQPMIEGCLEHNLLRPYFNAIFGCRMDEADPGDGHGPGLSFPKETVNFTVKTQKLFSISKGSWRAGTGVPDVNAKIKQEDLRVPFPNMLYLGDGHSDLAAFALLRQFGGYSIAVHHPGDERAEARAREFSVVQNRAHQYHEADFRPGSGLRQAILNWATQASGRDKHPELALP